MLTCHQAKLFFKFRDGLPILFGQLQNRFKYDFGLSFAFFISAKFLGYNFFDFFISHVKLLFEFIEVCSYFLALIFI